MYRLRGWFPHQHMNGASFCIILTPKWKESVLKSGITQEQIDSLIENCGNAILEGHGRSSVEKHMIHCYIRVKWGEWGPEHITVPGDACGLDIDKHGWGCHDGEASLDPHNVDSISQSSMLLTVFIKIAELLEY